MSAVNGLVLAGWIASIAALPPNAFPFVVPFLVTAVALVTAGREAFGLSLSRGMDYAFVMAPFDSPRTGEPVVLTPEEIPE